MTTGPLLELQFTLAGLATARRRLATCLAQAGLREARAEDFLLAVHEVMCNAIKHGGGSGQVLLYRDASMLRCEVTDHGAGLSHRKIPRALPGPGRCGSGLWLVRELTDSVTISANGHGTIVTLQVRLLPGTGHDTAAPPLGPAAHQPVPPAAEMPR